MVMAFFQLAPLIQCWYLSMAPSAENSVERRFMSCMVCVFIWCVYCNNLAAIETRGRTRYPRVLTLSFQLSMVVV